MASGFYYGIAISAIALLIGIASGGELAGRTGSMALDFRVLALIVFVWMPFGVAIQRAAAPILTSLPRKLLGAVVAFIPFNLAVALFAIVWPDELALRMGGFLGGCVSVAAMAWGVETAPDL